MTGVPYFRPNISKEEIELVASSLESGWLTSGPRVAEFEKSFAEAVGAKYAIALNSCTAALHLALLALEVGEGDEVIVPTLTFAATAEVVLAVGAVPVLVDVLPDTLAIDFNEVRSAITPKTRAIMAMHYGGSGADMHAALEIQAENPQIAIIEDAAHAFPARHELGMIGSIGDATCFSFYANKTMTTGEGGMLTTNDPRVAEHARRLSLHGLSRDAWSRFETRSSWDYDIVEAGWKYNMTDAAGSLGLGQLARSEEMAEMRRAIAARYDAAFADVPGITPRNGGELERNACHLYVVRVDSAVSGVSRSELISLLADSDIGTSVHYRPLHMHSFYAKSYDFKPDDFPVAAKAFEEIVSLPMFPGMTNAEVDLVVERIRLATTS